MITADTITDEQIRELARELDSDSHMARRALVPADGHSDHFRNNARARCAEILNARGGK